MRNSVKICAVGVAMLCLPFCGGWGAVAEAPEEKLYDGGELITMYANQRLPYFIKTIEEDIATPNNVPYYYEFSQANACGPIAGAIAMGYYDSYYPDIIADWTSAYADGKYKGKDGTYVPALVQDLYGRMKTNTTGAGVTVNNFKSGLSAYVSAHGQSITYPSLWNGSFDYKTFKEGINDNRIAVLFTGPDNVYEMESYPESSWDVLIPSQITANHVMIAYGYLEIHYFVSTGTRTDRYLRVATGLYGNEKLYKVNNIDSAYQLKIV